MIKIAFLFCYAHKVDLKYLLNLKKFLKNINRSAAKKMFVDDA